MKITIDTSQDSHEDIRKAIRLLQGIVGQQGVYTNAPSRNIFDDPSPALGPSEQPSEETSDSAFASIFDSPAPASESEETKEEKEDIPEIQFY
ncbi:hypothetical protein KY339_00340 [Candidatus Woesearchaeota archaeon]|nr:hypothetical protein [Candidatus Woesearchaeota archaeon]